MAFAFQWTNTNVKECISAAITINLGKDNENITYQKDIATSIIRGKFVALNFSIIIQDRMKLGINLPFMSQS